MPKFKQRGNVTDCVQWTGFNLDEVKKFVLAHINADDLTEMAMEFNETLFKHLVIIVNRDFNHAIIMGGHPISRGTWLVDQGARPENWMGFVLCEEQRFDTLYEPVTEEEQ